MERSCPPELVIGWELIVGFQNERSCPTELVMGWMGAHSGFSELSTHALPG